MTLRDEVLALYDRLRPAHAGKALEQIGLTFYDMKLSTLSGVDDMFATGRLLECQAALQKELGHPSKRFRKPRLRIPKPDPKQSELWSK